MKRAAGPSALASTRATIRSTRLQLAAPSKNSLKRRALPSFGAASKRLRAGLEALDVPAQRRGRGDAQDIIETIGSTPVEDFRTAIMVVGAQQYLGVGPVGPDRPQQAAQEGANLLATRPFGGAKHRRGEAGFAAEHETGRDTAFVVMRIEQP